MLQQSCACRVQARGARPPGPLPGGCMGRQPVPLSAAWSMRPPVCRARLRRGGRSSAPARPSERTGAGARRRSWSWCARQCMRRGRWGASLPRARARTPQRRERGRGLWPRIQGCGSGVCASALLPDAARALARCGAVRAEKVRGVTARCAVTWSGRRIQRAPAQCEEVVSALMARCEELVWSGRQRASARPRAAAVPGAGGHGYGRAARCESGDQGRVSRGFPSAQARDAAVPGAGGRGGAAQPGPPAAGLAAGARVPGGRAGAGGPARRVRARRARRARPAARVPAAAAIQGGHRGRAAAQPGPCAAPAAVRRVGARAAPGDRGARRPDPSPSPCLRPCPPQAGSAPRTRGRLWRALQTLRACAPCCARGLAPPSALRAPPCR